jgi:hypothetical protein
MGRRILEKPDEDTFLFLMPLDDQHPIPLERQLESRMPGGDDRTA